MVTNIDCTIEHKMKTRNRRKHRTQWVIQYPTSKNPAESLQENALTVFIYLRDIESVIIEKFKFELEKFLNSFPMSQKCPTMSPQQEATASLTSYLIVGVKELTQVVEAPTRPWSRIDLNSCETTLSKYQNKSIASYRCCIIFDAEVKMEISFKLFHLVCDIIQSNMFTNAKVTLKFNQI